MEGGCFLGRGWGTEGHWGGDEELAQIPGGSWCTDEGAGEVAGVSGGGRLGHWGGSWGGNRGPWGCCEGQVMIQGCKEGSWGGNRAPWGCSEVQVKVLGGILEWR